MYKKLGMETEKTEEPKVEKTVLGVETQPGKTYEPLKTKKKRKKRKKKKKKKKDKDDGKTEVEQKVKDLKRKQLRERLRQMKLVRQYGRAGALEKLNASKDNYGDKANKDKVELAKSMKGKSKRGKRQAMRQMMQMLPDGQIPALDQMMKTQFTGDEYNQWKSHMKQRQATSNDKLATVEKVESLDVEQMNVPISEMTKEEKDKLEVLDNTKRRRGIRRAKPTPAIDLSK